MNPGLEIYVIWFDHDVIELRVRASNGCFQGATDLYAAHDDLKRIAEVMWGFPKSSTDMRKIELGTFNPQHAGGGATLALGCTDGAGHVALHVQLRTDKQHEAGPAAAEFSLPVEPSAIDTFVSALKSMPLEIGAGATMRGAI